MIPATGLNPIEVSKDFPSLIAVTDAPLHNPAEADGIYAFMKVLPNVPEVAVFDTSFHQSLDPVQYLYSVPYKYYEKFRARNMGCLFLCSYISSVHG